MAEGWLAHCSEPQIDCDSDASICERLISVSAAAQAQCKKEADKQHAPPLAVPGLGTRRAFPGQALPPDAVQHRQPDEFSPENSIAETKLISGHSEAPAYPPQLDRALPIFSASLFRALPVCLIDKELQHQ